MRCWVATPVYLVLPADVARQHGLALGLPRRLDLLVEHVDPLEHHRAVLAGQPVERDVGRTGSSQLRPCCSRVLA